MMAQLEHVNITVADPRGMAVLLGDLFGWKIRWEGSAMDGAGYTIHVGSDDSYVALYSGSGGTPVAAADSSYRQIAGLNHIGVVVDDLAVAESRVKAAGLTPGAHHDYEPGRRFYVDTPHEVEIEVISYA